MNDVERIEKARRWRLAATERRDHSRREVEAEASNGMPAAWWSAQQSIIDSMQDRISLIDGLFPEIASAEFRKGGSMGKSENQGRLVASVGAEAIVKVPKSGPVSTGGVEAFREDLARAVEPVDGGLVMGECLTGPIDGGIDPLHWEHTRLRNELGLKEPEDAFLCYWPGEYGRGAWYAGARPVNSAVSLLEGHRWSGVGKTPKEAVDAVLIDARQNPVPEGKR